MPMEAPPEAAEGEAPPDEPGWKDHLCDVVSKIFSDDALSMEEKRSKLMQALDMMEEEEPKKPIEEADDMDLTEEEKKKKEEMKESLQRKCVALCKVAGYDKPEAWLIESLMAMKTEDARYALLAGLPKRQAGEKPRSSFPGHARDSGGGGGAGIARAERPGGPGTVHLRLSGERSIGTRRTE